MSAELVENRNSGPVSTLMGRIVEYQLSVATPEERERYQLAVAGGQLGSILSAVESLGKSHYRQDMISAYNDPSHSKYGLARSLAESGISDDDREVFAWIAGPYIVSETVTIEQAGNT